MPTQHLIKLNDGAEVPWIAFGTGTAHYNQNASEVVRMAIDNGFTHLDGAQVYENEETLGEGIKASGKPRSELFITTKLNKLAPGETVKQSLQASLQKLGVDYVDLFLIHFFVPWAKEGRIKEVWKGMEEVKKEGLAKSIGVSNFRIEDIKEVLDGASIVPAVNQLEFHPYIWKTIEPLVKLHNEHGIVTASYGGQTPVARVPEGPLTPVLETIRARLEEARGKPVTAGQVLTKWLAQKGAIVVTTSSKAERVKEYLDSANVPDLTEEEIGAIETTGAKLHKRIFLRQHFGE
ncbi:hypothetical protein HGRIS_012878 [Hohenbuehelia grisea]|uniref:NADP-dependent oxidoreductase domain-containing protein n=1 Tax=Hohenbuehelia grisea TaxID=104357 RepID=A0ABR3ITY7_9AGAR